MRVLLVGNYVPDQQRSMAAFSLMLFAALKQDGHDVSLVTPSVKLLAILNVNTLFRKWIAYIDKFILYPFELRSVAKSYDVIHICDHSNAMYVHWLRSRATVVTCHDVIAIEAARGLIPGWKTGLMGRIFQRLIFSGLNKASSVVCVSEFTREHLLNLNCRSGNVSVSLNALNGDFRKITQEEIKATKVKLGLPPHMQYFLHVGSDLPRKNRIFVLQVFAELRNILGVNINLIFVGPAVSMEMKKKAKVENFANSVFVIDRVSHDELVGLYSGALGLIFPSIQEGFGWPVIEAQACGCRVFCSNLAPMTEVGGIGAEYFNLDSPEKAAALIASEFARVGDSEAILKGRENLQRFSREKMVKNYLLAYRYSLRNSNA